MKIEIRTSELKDVRELSKNIRKKDQDEIYYLGYQPHKGLYYSFKRGLYRKTAFVDGKIAAMWGVTGAPLGLIGQPYLITSPVFETVSPLLVARLYKKEVEIMLQIFPRLENYTDFRYKEAIKLLKIGGFTVDDPVELGPNKALFCKFHVEIA